jgi:hypothetical protein
VEKKRGSGVVEERRKRENSLPKSRERERISENEIF